jgi:hypothetical protein
MKLIYLNRWGMVFHAILTTVTEEEDRVLASRVCVSLEETRRLIEGWQAQHGIADNDIHDNSRLALNELLAGIETDFTPRNN